MSSVRPIFSLKRLAGSYLGTQRLFLILIAAVVGVLTGFIAVGFIHALDWLHELAFVQGKDFFRGMGPYFVIFIPAAGALIAGPLITYFAPEAKGHGVPEVLKAIAIRAGRIRPMVVVIKVVASVLAIGTGGSMGREGPIVQVGSALGSSIAQALKLNEERIKNLIGCGAAAGIAAVFNAPIAGVLFALEVILKDFTVQSLGTVVIAAVSASVVSHSFLGDTLAFVAPAYSLKSGYEIFIYAGLGILSAFIGVLFVEVLNRSVRLFSRWPFPSALKPAIGGLLVGAIGLYFPEVFGTGLSAIGQALHGELAMKLLICLILWKIVATSISLGSGSSGGILSPSFLIGAALGGTVGKLMQHVGAFPVAPEGAYAIVGMASVFTAVAHAPITAILIVFEMTGDYHMILPLMAGVVTASLLSQHMSRVSIYTRPLHEEGIDLDAIEDVKAIRTLKVRDAMTKEFVALSPETQPGEAMDRFSKKKDHIFFLTDKEGVYRHLIKPAEIQRVLFEKDPAKISLEKMTEPLTDYAFADESLDSVARFMVTHGLKQMPVVPREKPEQVIGVLKADEIFHSFLNLTSRYSRIFSYGDQNILQPQNLVTFSFTVTAESPVAGMLLRDLHLKKEILITSIKRGNKFLIPHGETVLQTRDRAWAVVPPQYESEVREWMKENRLTFFYV